MFHNLDCGFTLVTMTNTQTNWFGIFNPMHTILIDYCNTTTATTVVAEKQLTVFPNPSSGIIAIESAFPIEKMIVVDILGEVVHRSTPNSTAASLELIGNGCYALTIVTDQETTTSKLIVNK